MMPWNELWRAMQTVDRASLTGLIPAAAVAATEAGTMAASPRRAGAALEHLFDGRRGRDARAIAQPGAKPGQ